MAPAPRRGEPHTHAVPIDRLVVVEHHGRITDLKLEHSLFEAVLALGLQGRAPNKVRVLIPSHGETEARLQGSILGPDIVTPMAVTLLEATTRHRVKTARAKVERFALAHDFIENMKGELRGNVELPAQLTHIGDPHGPH